MEQHHGPYLFTDLGEARAHAEAIEYKEKREEASQKRQFSHDWKVSIVGVVGGAISGGLVSFIFWLVQENLK